MRFWKWFKRKRKASTDKLMEMARKEIREVASLRTETPVYSLHIDKLPDGQWEIEIDYPGDTADGRDVIAAMVLHVHHVAEVTGQDGNKVLADLVQLASDDTMTFYPAFDGL